MVYLMGERGEVRGREREVAGKEREVVGKERMGEGVVRASVVEMEVEAGMQAPAFALGKRVDTVRPMSRIAIP